MKLFILFACLVVGRAEPNPDITSGIVSVVTNAYDKVSSTVKDVIGFFTNAWNSFKKIFNKQYSSKEEEKMRQKIFAENSDMIQKSGTNLSFFQMANKFTDMTLEEFVKQLNGFGRTKTGIIFGIEKINYYRGVDFAVPDSVDWRLKGAVTPVKDQVACAACYAFSAAGALEGQIFKQTKTLKNVSVQNLIDCTYNYGNDGCVGGFVDVAFKYVSDNSGINPDEKYPYEAKKGECRYKDDLLITKSRGVLNIPPGDEEILKQAVATVGPISAVMYGSLRSFQFYRSGIYFDPECKKGTSDVNHAVLIVGYGTTKGLKYWLVKNSYGKDWGMGGYFKIVRGTTNHCGIATMASFPLINVTILAG